MSLIRRGEDDPRLGRGVIAACVNSDLRREVLGLDIGPSRAWTFRI
jgi:hypothetical protein